MLHGDDDRAAMFEDARDGTQPSGITGAMQCSLQLTQLLQQKSERDEYRARDSI